MSTKKYHCQLSSSTADVSRNLANIFRNPVFTFFTHRRRFFALRNFARFRILLTFSRSLSSIALYKSACSDDS